MSKNIILFNTEIKYMKLRHRERQGCRYYPVYCGRIGSLNHFVVSICVRSVRLSRSGSCFESDDVFFEEALADSSSSTSGGFDSR